MRDLEWYWFSIIKTSWFLISIIISECFALIQAFFIKGFELLMFDISLRLIAGGR